MTKSERTNGARAAADQMLAQGIDWTKPLRELSKSTGLSSSTLGRLAGRLKIERPIRVGGRDAMEQYEDVDWSMSDAEIGRLKGKTRARIGQVRKALGQPPSSNSYRAWFDEHRHLNGLVDVTDLAAMLNTSVDSARNLARKYKLELKKSRDYHLPYLDKTIALNPCTSG